MTILRAPALYGPGLKGKLAALTAFMARTGFIVAPPADGPRSTLHVRHLAFAIAAALEDGLDGLRFAADPWPFSLGLAAEALSRPGRRVSVIRLPAWALSPLRSLAPGAYQSLYGRSLVAPTEVIPATGRCVLSPADALGSLLRG